MGANLKEVRERIKSVNNTKEITKAMKMVSAAKLRRAQEAIQQIRPYADKLQEILKNLLSNMSGDTVGSYGEVREPVNILLVVVTSNRGLAGAFNSSIIKKVVLLLEDKYKNQVDANRVTIACVGKRGCDYFRKKYPHLKVINDFVDLFNDLTSENINRLTNKILLRYDKERYDVVEVIYSKFQNPAVQIPQAEQFLPVPKIEVSEEEKTKRADYIFEPGEKELLEYLIPAILQTQMQKYMLDTHAAEHGARMTAMDSATENANELLKELRINYNKARQEAITRELSEIVGGAAALGG